MYPSSFTQTERNRLRQFMRNKRRALSPQQQRLAAEKLRRHTRALQPLGSASRIALYWPNDGELDPRLLAHAAWKKNIRTYLPVLHPWRARTLWFVPYTGATRFKKNRFGIAEPICKRGMIGPKQLDIIFMPLVAFDARGGRLGMGGGFYDTTLAYKKNAKGARKPFLAGVAHSLQQLDYLPVAPWDIPLDAIITEREIIYPRKN